jgi:hypothetical protein
MECLNTHSALSGYLDGWATEQERRDVERHLSSCEHCSTMMREFRTLRRSMSELPVRKPTPKTSSELLVLASRASARRRRRLSLAHAIHDWYSHARFGIEHMMRPLALPVAGGLLSTIALFAMLVPDLAHEVHPVKNDIETSVFTQATVKEIAPVWGVHNNDIDITVDLFVDENGRMLEYRVVSGQNLLQTESIRRSLENNLMYGQFYPATQFGQPVAGKLRVSFRTSTIDIKG